jgi:hypothetical protein
MHLYPDQHRFEFHEPSDGGLAVTIEIPVGADAADVDQAQMPNMESVA